MSRYTSMKLFRYNPELVIKKYLFSLHYLLPGIDSISNEQVLSGMITYNYDYNYVSILFELAISFLLKL